MGRRDEEGERRGGGEGGRVTVRMECQFKGRREEGGLL